MGFSGGPVYIWQESEFVRKNRLDLLKVNLDLELLVHFTGEQKSIKELFPKINEPVYKKPEYKMKDGFLSQENTDPGVWNLKKENAMDWKCTLLTVFRYKLDQQNNDKKVSANVTECFHKDWFGLGTGGSVWKHPCKSDSVQQQRTNSRSSL